MKTRTRKQNKTKQNKRSCYNCRKKGHITADCLEPEKGTSEYIAVGTEINLMAKTATTKASNNVWVADSDASCHMINNIKQLTNVKTKLTPMLVVVGNENEVVITKSGNWKGKITLQNGKMVTMQLNNVDYVLELIHNLFLLTMSMKKKWKLGNNGQFTTITKDTNTIQFDQLMHSPKGYVCGIKLYPSIKKETTKQKQELATIISSNENNYLKFHTMLGHPGKWQQQKHLESPSKLSTLYARTVKKAKCIRRTQRKRHW